MTIPTFDKKYVVFIESYVGDADHYTTDIWETDDLRQAEFIQTMTSALGASFKDNGYIKGAKGFGGHAFSQANLDLLEEQLKKDFPEIMSNPYSDLEDLGEFIRDSFSSPGEGYWDMEDYWRTVTCSRLVKVNNLEVIK